MLPLALLPSAWRLTQKAWPVIVAFACFVLLAAVILNIRNLKANLLDETEARELAEQRYEAEKLATAVAVLELDALNSAMAARDAELAAAQERLAERSATLRRVLRRPENAAWGAVRVPAAVLVLVRGDGGSAGDAAGAPAGGAAE